jgi:hypothetical protein
MYVNSSADENRTTYTPARSFALWGIGTQVMYGNFTVGGSYVNAGHYATYTTGYVQNEPQDVWSVGIKYEKDNYALALNGLHGRGYFNSARREGALSSSEDCNYVREFNALGAGATYTWFPGLTSAVDVVIFEQIRADVRTAGGVPMDNNTGNVIMFSQKMTF